ncbi:MAG: hypothetical protein V4519_02090 [Patescibacteria group bacterium]
MSVGLGGGATSILDSVAQAAYTYNLRAVTTTSVTRVQPPLYLQRQIVARNTLTGAATVKFTYTINPSGPRATHTRLVIRQQQTTGTMRQVALATFKVYSTDTTVSKSISGFQRGGVYSVTGQGVRITVSSTGSTSTTISAESTAVWIKP